MRLEDATAEDSVQRTIRHDLRGALNALHLSLRVLDGRPTDVEAGEFARHILDSAQKLERLMRDLYPIVEPRPVMLRAAVNE